MDGGLGFGLVTQKRHNKMTIEEAKYYATKKKEALLEKPMELFYLGFRAGKAWQKVAVDKQFEELTK